MKSRVAPFAAVSSRAPSILQFQLEVSDDTGFNTRIWYSCVQVGSVDQGTTQVRYCEEAGSGVDDSIASAMAEMEKMEP